MKRNIHRDSNNGTTIAEPSTTASFIFRRSMVFLLVVSFGAWSGCKADSELDSSSSDSSTTDGSDSESGDVPLDSSDGGPPDGQPGAPPDGQPGGGQDSCDLTTLDKSGVYSQEGGTVSESGKTYEATDTDQSAVYVYGAGTYTLSDATLTKTGDASNENCSNFYGNNAIVLAEDASTISLEGVTLTSDSKGSNGAFAYGTDSVVNLENCTISTSGSSARGVDATYGGTINVKGGTITTTGDHCSALATDRYDTTSGPPKVNAYSVKAEVSGSGSCGAYSTGTFYIESSELIAHGSEVAVIEGANSITLVNTDLTADKEDQNAVMVYQSMSGDALGSTGVFKMTGGSITANGGPYLLNTNDEADFTLEDVTLSGSDVILKAGKINWMSSGDIPSNGGNDTLVNGGISHLTAIKQAMEGDLVVDEYGSITATLSDGSSLTGAIDPDNSPNSNSGDTEGGYVGLTLKDTSRWTATANSYVDTLDIPALASIDAGSGITITCQDATINDTAQSSGTYALASGGSLVVP